MAQRRALSAEEVEKQSQQITARLFADFFVDPTGLIVHTFLPIVRQNEVDTWPIIYRIWQNLPQIQVAVSVTDIATNRLAHYALTPETPLVENRLGIAEPQSKGCMAISSDQIDVVLVPLLAFDTRGHRVGYGKGYYDQFLSECRPDCLKIGLSLFEPILTISDVEPTDIRLDAGVTPKRTHNFNRF